ncbi:hypothetical protein DUD43_06455 [Alcaligenes faecalis]|uniref:hypothetical protein n=1 Tax=Alcaligenes faecalis TaxID=511 RepID=UPI001292D009|nr:hypothetical protein [Alcaligenes faecalis]QFY77343.1 hypothetical protein DUD43_06455 [Alcaligenes faecalis]
MGSKNMNCNCIEEIEAKIKEPATIWRKHLKGPAAQQPVSGADLSKALRDLTRGYVNLLENGRDRILDLGGQCDPVDVMEASDPWLKSARAALAPAQLSGITGQLDHLPDATKMIKPSGNPGNLPELTIQWHDTPEAVHRIFWEKTAIENGLTYEELIEGAMVGETEERQKVDLTYEQEIQAIRDQKCWGCADTDTNQIHVWAAPDVDRALLIHMLAHEIGHLTGEPHPDDIQEELRAETFGKVAALAYHMLPSSRDINKVPADPLQGAADWLVKDCGVSDPAGLANRLGIGYNRACRLVDAARKEGQI